MICAENYEKGDQMITELANSAAARMEFLKWVSERNADIPVSDIEFLMGMSPLENDDEE